MTQYAVIIEKNSTGSYGAYVPDLPGCAAVGDSPEQVRHLIREGIEIYIGELRRRGEPVPEPSTTIEYVALASPEPLSDSIRRRVALLGPVTLELPERKPVREIPDCPTKTS